MDLKSICNKCGKEQGSQDNKIDEFKKEEMPHFNQDEPCECGGKFEVDY